METIKWSTLTSAQQDKLTALKTEAARCQQTISRNKQKADQSPFISDLSVLTFKGYLQSISRKHACEQKFVILLYTKQDNVNYQHCS